MKNITISWALTLFCLAFSVSSEAVQRLPCYQSQRLPFPKDVVYQSIKSMLVRSNFTISHSEKDGDLITANGFVGIDDDALKSINLTVTYEELKNDVTLVTIAGSYADMERRSELVTVGGGPVTLPIPLFFRKNVAVEKTGSLTDPNIYRVLYLNIYNAIIETHANRITADPILKADQALLPAEAVTQEKTNRVQESLRATEMANSVEETNQLLEEAVIAPTDEARVPPGKVIQETTSKVQESLRRGEMGNSAEETCQSIEEAVKAPTGEAPLPPENVIQETTSKVQELLRTDEMGNNVEQANQMIEEPIIAPAL